MGAYAPRAIGLLMDSPPFRLYCSNVVHLIRFVRLADGTDRDTRSDGRRIKTEVSPEDREQQVHQSDYAKQKTHDQEHRHPDAGRDGNPRRLGDGSTRFC